MGIFPKVNIKETFVGVKKLLETCVEKIKDFFIGDLYDPHYTPRGRIISPRKLRFWRCTAQKVMERRSECILRPFLAPLRSYSSLKTYRGEEWGSPDLFLNCVDGATA